MKKFLEQLPALFKSENWEVAEGFPARLIIKAPDSISARGATIILNWAIAQAESDIMDSRDKSKVSKWQDDRVLITTPTPDGFRAAQIQEKIRGFFRYISEDCTVEKKEDKILLTKVLAELPKGSSPSGYRAIALEMKKVSGDKADTYLNLLRNLIGLSQLPIEVQPIENKSTGGAISTGVQLLGKEEALSELFRTYFAQDIPGRSR